VTVAARVLGRDRPLARDQASAALEQLKQSKVEIHRDARFTGAPELAGPAGKFVFRFPAPKAGVYRLELRVPGASDPLGARFRVEAPDPELDETRPHFELLYRLASPVGEATLREGNKRAALLAALRQSRQQLLGDAAPASLPRGTSLPSPPTNDATTSVAEGERLFFSLETAPWIAELLDANPITFRTEGRPQDLWDKGFDVFWHLDDPRQSTGPPWAMVLVITLLGTEWLTRKLLRLA
jgi:hypothetical protein